jgi:ABC-2 type transport system permease protein
VTEVAAARLALHQLRYELLAFWRTPQAVFFTFALPVLMLVIFAQLNEESTIASFGGRSYAAFFVPGMLTFGLASATYGNLSARTVVRRETGQLKRLRATPLPARAYLAGAVANATLVAAAVSVAVMAVGRIGYDVALPGNKWAVAGVLVLAAACCSALGLALSTFVASPESADPVVFGTMLPVVFISGVFQVVPPDSVLHRVASVFPVQPMLDSLRAGYLGRPISTADLLVVVAWGTAGALVAARRFAWTPS